MSKTRKAQPKSMTGFGSSTTAIGVDGDQLRWELRSVNAKGLDIRLKLPSGYEATEPKIKRHIQARFKRGSIHVNCTLARREDAKSHFELNDIALRNYLTARRQIEVELGPFAPVDFEQLALDSRFQISDKAQALLPEERQEDLIATLEPALEALDTARLSEGAKLQTVLLSIVEQIKSTLSEVLAQIDDATAYQNERLNLQISSLIGDHKIDQDRLAQEIALLATKADIREETDRLQAHCQEAEALLHSVDPIGRRLDFLAQEFNREANTLCAKAATNEITRLGLDLKTMIDQFREQTQNIE